MNLNTISLPLVAKANKRRKKFEKLAAEQHGGLHCQASDRARLGVISISQILEAKSHQKYHIEDIYCYLFQCCSLYGLHYFVVPYWDYWIGSNFWKFYLIRIGFTLGDPVSLVKMFRLFRLEWIFLVFTVWTE
jgi:hypothetical protein